MSENLRPNIGLMKQGTKTSKSPFWRKDKTQCPSLLQEGGGEELGGQILWHNEAVLGFIASSSFTDIVADVYTNYWLIRAMQ